MQGSAESIQRPPVRPAAGESACARSCGARRLPGLLLVLALLAGLWPVPSQAAEKLTAEQVAALVPQLFRLHLKEREMNPPLMKRLLKEFVNNLDPTRSFFLKSEAEAIANLRDEDLKCLADRAREADFSSFATILSNFLKTQVARDEALYDGLEGRAEEIKALSKEKPKAVAGTSNKTPPDKAAPKESTAQAEAPAATPEDDEENEGGIKWTERPATNLERETRLLRSAALAFRIHRTYMSDNDAMRQALQSVREDRKKWLKAKLEDEVPKLFLKSFMTAMDPHTAYFDAEEDEEFTARLEPSFAGIGVQIRPVPMGAYVEEVIKGGPAERSGKFARGDQIVRVDDVVLAGMTINKIVRRIKGEKGTDVKLTVLKRNTQQTEPITLKRDTIKLADLRVKGKKFETPAGVVGMVSVTTFYRSDDKDGHTNGVTEDVRDRILELSKDKPLAGLVLDLRDNHGGYLEEAVALAGLFIGAGPIVGERDGRKNEDWKYDRDPNIVYAGPLVVLVNQFSASASEIVAGALKDYGRAVVASPTQTFGKGTVQRVIPLSTLNLPGEIKITTHQYFLAGGSSVQQKGVEPDVVIPGAKLYAEALEKAQEGSIPWDTIKGKLDTTNPDVQHWTEWKTQNTAILQGRSNARVAANPKIKDFFDLKKRRAKLEAEQQQEKPRNPDEAPPLPDTKKDEEDPQAEEAVAIAQDMAATWPKPDKQAAK